jgi:sterol O-acyltransferase
MMITPPSSTVSSSDLDHHHHHRKANTDLTLGSSLRNALSSTHRTTDYASSSGSTTPLTALERKSRQYLLTDADDEEIRQILLARLDRHDPPQKRVRMRDLVFSARLTTFDRQNPLLAESPFRGFFTLFWLAIALMLCKVAANNWRVHRSVLGNAEVLHMVFDRNVLVLGVTDLVMVASTATGLGLQKLVAARWVSWRRTGRVVQNLWQTLFLGVMLAWIWWREMNWPATLFILLHTFVFLMKQHSYAFYNGYRKSTQFSPSVLVRYDLHQLI